MTPASSGFAEKLGMAAYLMSKSDNYCQYPIACLTLWIEPAIIHEQIHFFFDCNGNLAGYLTWALLDVEAENRFISEPDVLLHISEWNEGDRLWLLDLVVINNNLKSCVSEARELFGNFASARSLRRRDDGSVKKITKWTKAPKPA